MTDDNAARESRRTLIDSVAGKAKEVAGALTGKDDLAQEGQLQQADAEVRREANSREALADAATRESVEQLRAEQRDAEDLKHEAYRDAGAKERVIAGQIETEKARAEQRALQLEQAERARSEDAAASEARQAAADAARLRDEAVVAEVEADEQAARLDADADDAERAAAALRTKTDAR